jgi:hypothetical protein
VRQAEEKLVMKVGLFINTQFPAGFKPRRTRPGDGGAGACGA